MSGWWADNGIVLDGGGSAGYYSGAGGLMPGETGGDMITSRVEGDWTIYSGGFGGNTYRVNNRTGATETYNYQTDSWTPGGGLQVASTGGASTGGASTGGVTDYQAYFNQLTAGKPPTPDTLVSLESQLNAQGIQVLRNAAGTAGKIKLPNGQIIDVIQSAGTGGKAWQWLGPSSSSATGSSAPGGLPPGFETGTFTGGGQYPLASVMGPGLMQPWTTPFQAPDPQEIAKNPAYQWRLQQGAQAIERGAAAKGTLLSGGTLKDLESWSQGLASTEYDNAYNRALGEYQQAYGIFSNNQANQYSRLSGMVNQGAQAASAGAGLNSQFGQQGGGALMDIGNAQAAGTAAGGAAWGGATQNIGNTIGQYLMLRDILNQPRSY